MCTIRPQSTRIVNRKANQQHEIRKQCFLGDTFCRQRVRQWLIRNLVARLSSHSAPLTSTSSYMSFSSGGWSVTCICTYSLDRCKQVETNTRMHARMGMPHTGAALQQCPRYKSYGCGWRVRLQGDGEGVETADLQFKQLKLCSEL